MKVFIKGHGEVNLTQQNFVATGGQASVYVRTGTAYKIYTDPKDMIPEAKFHALAAINDPCVIKPGQVLLDTKSVPCGYTMDAVKDNFSFCQLFTKSFRERENVSHDHIVDLAAKLRGHIENVHRANILIVDLNELNILVSQKFDETYLIDVDSYQTKGYPATVIMPSVRDYSVPAKEFSPLSDWFSYGVLAFQLFIGMHPYRGTHAGSAHIHKDHRLEHRMKNRISAFNPEVKLPGCCYSFDSIPQTFREWLKAVLEDGKRLAPPDPHGGPVAVITTAVQPFLVSSGNITIVEMVSFEGWRLVSYAESSGVVLALVQKGSEMRALLNGRTIYTGPALLGTSTVGFTPKMNQPVCFNLSQGQVTFLDLNKKSTEVLGLVAHEIQKSGDRFYIRNGTQVLEVEFSELMSKILVTASHAVANVLELASHLYEGCAIQNMLGSIFVSTFPKSKTGYQVRVPELDKYKILEAKCDGGVLMVVGARDGKYDRLIFRFDEDYESYDLRVVDDITPTGLNFVTLSSGICVSLTEDEKIEAFSAKKGSQQVKRIEDPALSNDMRFLKVSGKVGFERAGKVYQMMMK